MSGEWKSVRLDELTAADSPITYGVVKPGDPGDVLFIRGGDIADGRILDGQLRTITREVSEQYRRTLLRGGELLISLVGQPGQVAVASSGLAGANIARQVGLIRLRNEVDANFVSYFLQSPDGKAGLGTYTGGSVQQVINLGDLRTVTVPVPPLPEQQRIVGILDEAFDGITTAKANAEQNLQNARALFESHLQSVFTQCGEGWVEKTIGEACILRSGTTLPKEIEKSSGEIPYLKVADMNITENLNGVTCSSRYVNKHDVNVSNLLPVGTTIFPKRGGAILTNKKRLTTRVICADLNIMGVTPRRGLLPEFLFNFFLRLDLREINNGSSIPQINNYSIEPLLIAFPESIAEQQAIVERLHSLSEETQRLESIYRQKLAALDELKKSLLHQAFTGQL